ncbi:ribonuclease P protein subunit p30 isoform X2 [Pantherophis guttatus]|uniref:Ribonuclease P protein subunit p30 n=1 Tax=Pantherophis guttatus TaxID=94885 RepID=A0A6P9CT28_PANGU|nr:ribonuclease P protein subunit p30 isoform X2 [Pantherophis guttatus]
MAAFADLNILYLPEKEALQKLVEAAAHLGYSTVAINYVVNYEEKKKEIVKPMTPAELFSSLPLVQGKSKPIKILSRLTLVVSDPSHCNVLRATSTNIKYYDIFAVFPKNAKLFHVACTTLDVDLVCVDVTEKLPFFIKRPSVNVAIERGVYFELIYVPAIKDTTMRRYTISNTFSLMQICRGKNIVLSSGAEKHAYLLRYEESLMKVAEVGCSAFQKAMARQLFQPTAELSFCMEKPGKPPVEWCIQ